MKIIILAFFSFVFYISAAVAADPYVFSYYAPPPEWVPEKAICDYSINTRVPDLTRIKYDGAYTMALRIRPITQAMLKKQMSVGVLSTKCATDILRFRPEEEKSVANRSIVIKKLNIPADDFMEISFKMKVHSENADENLTVIADGVTMLDTAKHADPATKCLDGFKAYKVRFPAKKGRVLRNIIITVPPAKDAKFQQEFILMDFMFKRNTPKIRYKTLPPRQWIPKKLFESGGLPNAQNAIPDIYSFVRSAREKEFKSLSLPFSYKLRPQTKKDKDGGFRTEVVREVVGGKEIDVLKIHLKKGPRCYLKFPVHFDGTDFNTMTFAAKVEVKGCKNKHLFIGRDKPNLFGANAATLNAPYDTFAFGATSSSHDHSDWIRYGVAQGDFSYHANKMNSRGWRKVALDLVNDDYANTKGTFNPKITHWCFYYKNAKLPDGAEVTVSIADPRVTRGLMRSGGDMKLYRKFLAGKKSNPLFGSIRASTDLPAFGGPQEGRCIKPLSWIRNHIPQGEIICNHQGYDRKYRIIVDRAIETMNSVFVKKYAITNPFQVLSVPSKKDNAKLFIGGNHYAKVNPKQYAADMKQLAGTPGCAIRAHGKNIYIYAASQGNYSGSARGLANGIYTFLENNTDVIMAYSWIRRWKPGRQMVFDMDTSGNMDIVWGNSYVNRPPFNTWGISGDAIYNDFNRAAFFTVWGNWEYGGVRAWATNHCWSYGTAPNGKNAKPNKTWGTDVNGKPMRPGCYTGHPCLINVLEKAKDAYLDTAFRPANKNKQMPLGKAFIWNTHDVMGLWVEDTLKVCQCPRCATPIRLADGSLVHRGEKDFLSTQFFENACAMINRVNVFARRDMKVESIAYFWMATVPRFELPRNYKVRFCPYIRKNYFVPIYAPANDVFWREFKLWGQTNVKLAIYEYFLFINFRPWADVFRYDMEEERRLGVNDFILEGGAKEIARAMEHWVVTRLLWEPERTPAELRSYFLRRTFREAGPDMEKFFSVFYDAVYKEFAPFQPMEFDDDHQLGIMALRAKTPSGITVSEEMKKYLTAAERKVRNPIAKKLLNDLRTSWNAYMKGARKKILNKE